MAKKRKSYKKEEKHFKFNIMNFNIGDYYLFNVTRYNNIIHGITNLNDIKLNKNEIILFQSELEKYKSINSKNNKKISINIIPEFFKFFNEIKKNDLKNSEYAKRVSFIINHLKQNKINITLKQISKQYQIFYGKKISISTISRILKNHLGMRHLKTSLKNPKIEENNYLFMSFVFIRIIFRCLYLNLTFVFLDETGFLLENNNYYTWRNENECVIGRPKNKAKERLNLILASSKDKIIHQKFLKNSIDTKVLIEFLNELIEQINEDERNKIIIVMDNASFHVGHEVIDFFKEKQIKGLTISPYRSFFNMAEFIFRYLKNIIYKNVYNNMESLKKDVNKILKSENLKNTLKNLFRETLQQYVLFIQNHENFDLSNIINCN